MLRQYTATGATVEEAIETACRELGVSPSEVTPEILRLPKKGFFKKVPAEVRVTVQSDEDILKQAASKPEKQAVVQKNEPEKAVKKPEQPSRPVEPAPRPTAPKTEVKTPVPQPEPSKPAVQETAVFAPAVPAVPTPEAAPVAAVSEEKIENFQPKMDMAKGYLLQVFEKMGISGLEIRMEPTENRTILIHLEGEEIGTVIGKRGETLDAIQYLVSLVANRCEGEYVRFTINAGNYREKREETLRTLAQKMARKVLKTGRPAALEPMNPYERRIIHAVVTEIEGVYSKSTGEEPNRKVVIKPSGRNSGNYRRDGRETREPRENRQNRRPPRPQKSEIPAVEPEAADNTEGSREVPEKPEKKVLDDNIKLYSKIEL